MEEGNVIKDKRLTTQQIDYHFGKLYKLAGVNKKDFMIQNL